jgi:hypothetical protein
VDVKTPMDRASLADEKIEALRTKVEKLSDEVGQLSV